MKKPLNLKLVLLVMGITLSFAIGNENWFNPIGGAICLYYFLFIANLFQQQYVQENIFTKIFFTFTKTPIYIAGIIVIADVFIRKSNPLFDSTYPYSVAALGVVTSIVGMIKRSQKRLIS